MPNAQCLRLHEDAPNAARVALDLSCELRPSAPWLSCATHLALTHLPYTSPILPYTSAISPRCATHLALTHGGKGFNLKVSPAGLPPGAHYAEVAGVDAAARGVGPLFVLPVTVLMPHADLRLPGAPPAAAFEGLHFRPGHIERRFVVPPRGASWATLCVRARAAPRSTEVSNSVVYMVHATQLLPHTHVGHTSSTTRVTMGVPATGGAAAHAGAAAGGGGAQPSTEYVKSMACEGGVMMEVAVAQWWMD